MSEDNRYDPSSLDANLSRIFSKLENIETTCVEIRTEAKKTNGRVTGLERFRDILTAKVSLISFLVAGSVTAIGWIATIYFK